jgi:acyl carrier protein
METIAGARVVTLRADVSRQADMARVFATIAEEMPPLRGVIHAAGVAENPVPVLDTRRETFERMFAPKVSGTCNLYALTKDKKLDFFILYSSASAMIGLVGQGSYAGANAFMDAMAVWGTQRGSNCMSIQWGAFSATGMVHDEARKRLAGAGMDAMTPEDGLMAVSRLLEHPKSNVAVMAFSFGQLPRLFPHIAQSQYFRELLPNRDDSPSTAIASSSVEMGILQELASAPADQKYELLESHLLRRIGEILRLDPSRIDRLAPFSSLGMDSLMSLELRNRLQPDLNLTLSATMLFAYPTPAALIAHIFERLDLVEKPQPALIQPPKTTASPAPVVTAQAASKPAPIVAKPSSKQNAVDEMEARLAAKLASLDKYLDDE